MGKNGINLLTGRIVESFNNKTGAVTEQILKTVSFNTTDPTILEFLDQDNVLIASIPFDAENIRNLLAASQDNKFRVVSIDPTSLTTNDESGVLEFLNIGLTISDKETIIIDIVGERKYFLKGLGKGSYGGANPLIVASNLLEFDLKGVSKDPNQALTTGSDGYPFLDSALLGGVTSNDEIKYFNPNYQQNLDFLWKAQWVFGGTLFTLDNDPQTSDPADATFSRIDVFALNADGTGSIIKGTPSADPVKPSIDPLTQLEAGFILIDANATAPNGVTSDQVYNENLQVAGGEFDSAVYPNGTTRFILDSAVEPYTGTKHINGTDLQLYDAVEFTPSAPIAINQLSSLGYSIKIKSGSYNKHKGPSHRIQIQGTDGGGNPITIYLPEDNSVDIFNWATYQNSSALIPQDTTIINVTKIRLLSWVATSFKFGFYLDNVFLVKGTQSFKLENYATIKYVDEKDAETLQSANDYADSKETPTGAQAKADAKVEDQIIDGVLDIAPSQNSVFDALALKVDKDGAKQLSDENYTLAEKNKLAGLQSSKFKGTYLTDAALTTAHPAPEAGSYAYVDGGVGVDTIEWIWDEDDAKWVEGNITGSTETGATIKTKYEGEPDTNAFTDALLAKINSITAIFTTALKTAYDTAEAWVTANGANVIAHIQSAHAPSNAQKNSDILKAEIEAVLTGEIASHTHAGGGAAGDYSEERFTWATGNPNTFTLTTFGTDKVTDVYVQGKRLDKFQQDGVTPDEWQVNSPTVIEILIPIDDQDRINVVGTTVVVTDTLSTTTDYGLTGAIDGVNKTYTVSGTFEVGKVRIYLNGIRQFLTDDYTESGNNAIVFVDAPLSGDKIIADY